MGVVGVKRILCLGGPMHREFTSHISDAFKAARKNEVFFGEELDRRGIIKSQIATYRLERQCIGPICVNVYVCDEDYEPLISLNDIQAILDNEKAIN